MWNQGSRGALPALLVLVAWPALVGALLARFNPQRDLVPEVTIGVHGGVRP